MNFIKDKLPGFISCLIIAIPSWYIGKYIPVVGGAVFAIIFGMIVALFWNNKGSAANGIRFSSKTLLQFAVILLGFGLNLSLVYKTGLGSLHIIIITILTSLTTAYIIQKILKTPQKTSILIGVGSSICGGSAIAATAPVIDAKDDEIAQSISVIFFFNVIAALIFPYLGEYIRFSTAQNFGIFAGSAINDLSSVTAAASSWDSINNSGTTALDSAVTVKLTRTLAIIPITIILSFILNRNSEVKDNNKVQFNFFKSVPTFILLFILASIITTIIEFIIEFLEIPSSLDFFKYTKEISKFLIVIAMAGIGLNSNVIKLIKTGVKPILLGGTCSIAIVCSCILTQYLCDLI